MFNYDIRFRRICEGIYCVVVDGDCCVGMWVGCCGWFIVRGFFCCCEIVSLIGFGLEDGVLVLLYCVVCGFFVLM